jgi:hypothetical protein
MEVKNKLFESEEIACPEENIPKLTKTERIEFLEAEFQEIKKDFELLYVSHQDLLKSVINKKREQKENKLFEIGVMLLLGFFSASVFFILIYGSVLC